MMEASKRNKKKMTTFLFTIIILTILAIFSACSAEKATNSSNGKDKENSSALNEKNDDHVEVTYESHIQPLLASNCLACHGDQSPTLDEFDEDPDKYIEMMKGPRFDSYELLTVLINGEDAGALMRRLDDGTNRDDGEPGNMYRHLGASEAERQANLTLLKEWIGHWTLKRADELTDEDYEKFKVVEK